MNYSIVIATYNRAELLKNNIKALARQNVPKDSYEVIVVNDGSTDRTEAVVKEFISAYLDMNIVYLKQPNGGPAKARNLGVKQAKGNIVFFTDDDCVVPDKWIETLADGYRRHPEVAGVGGWYEYPKEMYQKSAFVTYTMWWMQKWYGIESKKEINNDSFRKNPAGNTSNMSYLKSILEESGGFDETINFVGMIDWDLKKRIHDLGYPLLFIPYPVTHLKPLGAKEIIRKFFNRGRGSHRLSKKNPELFPIYVPYFIRALRRINFERGPLSMRYMAFIDYFFTKLGWEYQKRYGEK